MAKWGANQDLNHTQLLNALLQILASNPGAPAEAQFWYNSTSKKLIYYDGVLTRAVVDTGRLPVNVAAAIAAATSKTTPVDADGLFLNDSTAAGVEADMPKRLTWANLKATLKTYFDGLYPAGSGTSTGTNTGDQTPATITGFDAAALAAAPAETTITLGAILNQTAYTPLVDDDRFGVADVGLVLRSTRWANIKAVLKTYFDGLYPSGSGTSTGTNTGDQTPATISGFDTQVRTSRLDQMAAPTATVSLGSQKISNQAVGTADTDGVNLGQVKDLVRVLDRKDSVRVAVDTNVNISNPGTAVFDGATLANGEALLLNGQTAGAEKGIYIFNGSGVPLTRRSDADISAEVTAGMTTVVEEGTYADKRAILTTNNPITLGTTALAFTFESTGETVVAGAGLTKTGSTLDVGTASAARIVVNANDIDLPTGVIAAAGTYRSVTVDTYGRVTAGTNPADRYSALLGDGSTTVFNYTAATHGRAGDQTLIVRVIEVSTGEPVLGTDTVGATGTVTLTWAVAPTTNQYRVVIM